MDRLNDNIIKTIRNKYPDVELKTCFEAIANGKDVGLTELHGFVIDNLYFVDDKTLEIYNLAQFIIVENIDNALLD